MPLRRHFPALTRFVIVLRNRIIGRVLLAFFVLILAVTTAARTYSFVLTRRMEAVVAGLGKLEIDKTSEEELVQRVPYLERSPWEGPVKRTRETGDVDTGMQRIYSVSVSNESSWMKLGRFIRPLLSCCTNTRFMKEGYEQNWVLTLADFLGYRYVYFGASVVLLDGKVSGIRYGVQDRLVFPRPFGEIVSVKSAHSFWASHQTGFEVQSAEDESPQFRVLGNEHGLRVSYTYDAPRDLAANAFQVDLTCFWGLRGCRHVWQIAPKLWHDKMAIEAATLARLQSREPCPSRIVAGRLRYLPDAGITLAESRGFRRVAVNVEGNEGVQTVTDFKLIEVFRSPLVGSLTGLQGRPSIQSPGDYEKRIPNYGPQWPAAGERILFFSNMSFDSCVMVPATLERISAVRNTSSAPRRIEDQTGLSLQ